ncbi:DoxX family protein [Phytomonospora sp. NPDC050363]|uniref:DoxX family protein n=1 Tax=Phytomonospora sp. NPDC050363 TaxID=3155642 RepID=UPI0033FB5230
MHLALWIVQAVLAVLFFLAGTVTVLTPKEKLSPKLPWADDFSAGVVRFIGAVEILGALGLILPAVTGVATVLVPAAATGLAVLMVAAAVVHLRRREPGSIVFNAVLFALAVFVAWGRYGS